MIEIPQTPQINTENMSPEQMEQTIRSQADEIVQLKQDLSNLMSMIRLNNSQKFGGSGDNVPYPEGYEQLNFFNEAEKFGRVGEAEPTLESATAKVPKKPKEKGKKERDLSGLSVTVVEHELPEEERLCPVCGNDLHEMKTEVTKVLKLIPAHFEVEEHRRHVYTCRECERSQEEGDKIPFIRAAMPELPIAGSFASAELLAGIINSKYVNHMPLARIEKEFFRMDSVEISRQTMSNWMLTIAERYFGLIHEKMKETLLLMDVIHADETYCTVAYEDGQESKKKCYMWIYCSGRYEVPVTYYEYHTSRAAAAADEFMKAYEGICHTDGYQVYHSLSPEIIVIGCLAHVKRKFTDAIKSIDPDHRKNTYCYRGQEYCDAIFRVEKRLKDFSPEERHNKRQVELKPLMDAFFEWLNEIFPKTVPDSPAYKALQYALNQWPYIENILIDGRTEATNNRCERNARPFAQGRRSWMTIKTNRGGSASAAIYSVVQTALENHLKVYEYLVYLFEKMPSENFIFNPEAIEKYVPWSKELPSQCYKTKEKSDN